MTDQERRVRVTDKRRARQAPSADEGSVSAAHEGPVLIEPGVESAGHAEAQPHDYLADLQRLQAEFDNYRKRTMREQTALAKRAGARLIERLLPVLDNFEAALAHGIEDAGVQFIYDEFKRTLAEEGLEEIPAEGRPFDPTVHAAFDAVEDDSVDGPTVVSVLRRGYRIEDKVLRPAMVKVARPPEAEAGSPADDEPVADGE